LSGKGLEDLLITNISRGDITPCRGQYTVHEPWVELVWIMESKLRGPRMRDSYIQ